jgi:hypothetical protein
MLIHTYVPLGEILLFLDIGRQTSPLTQSRLQKANITGLWQFINLDDFLGLELHYSCEWHVKALCIC